MKVLISAPYMLKDKAKVQKYLSEYNWDIEWAVVEERLEEDDLLKVLPSFDAIICGDDRFTEEVYKTCKNLKAVVKWGTGIDSINKDIADKYNVPVFRTPGAFTIPVSETTLAYMLSFCRNVITNDKVLKDGEWYKPDGKTLSECTVGLIGFGDIGQEVARKLKPFGCKVLVNDIKEIDNEVLNNLKVEYAEKDKIYKESDIISLHCDLNEMSNLLINEKAFKQMEKKPYLINTARGPLIKEVDLVKALESGQIEGAALDVFEEEPLSAKSPLRKSDKVILAAHNSNSSAFYWDKVHLNSIKMLAEVFERE